MQYSTGAPTTREFMMPSKHRSALSKFRCGVAPIRKETGHYENLKENEHGCHFESVLRINCMVVLFLYADVRHLYIS